MTPQQIRQYDKLIEAVKPQVPEPVEIFPIFPAKAEVIMDIILSPESPIKFPKNPRKFKKKDYFKHRRKPRLKKTEKNQLCFLTPKEKIITLKEKYAEPQEFSDNSDPIELWEDVSTSRVVSISIW